LADGDGDADADAERPRLSCTRNKWTSHVGETLGRRG